MMSIQCRPLAAFLLLASCCVSMAAADEHPSARILAVPEVARLLKVKQNQLSFADGQVVPLLSRFAVQLESARVKLDGDDVDRDAVPAGFHPDILLEIGKPNYEHGELAGGLGDDVFRPLGTPLPKPHHQLVVVLWYRVRIRVDGKYEIDHTLGQIDSLVTRTPESKTTRNDLLKQCLQKLISGMGDHLGQEMINKVDVQMQNGQWHVTIALVNSYPWTVRGQLKFPDGDDTVDAAARDFIVLPRKNVSVVFRATAKQGERKKPELKWWKKPYWRSKQHILFPQLILNPGIQPADNSVKS